MEGPAEETLNLEGVVLRRGNVVIHAPLASEQARAESILSSLGDEYALSRQETPTRRYVIGIPGYMVALGPEGIVKFLQKRNRQLPANSLTPVSLYRGKGARPKPVLFVELSEEGEAYLATVGFILQTLTGPVQVRPARNE
jgi:hypothetical protein